MRQRHPVSDHSAGPARVGASPAELRREAEALLARANEMDQVLHSNAGAVIGAESTSLFRRRAVASWGADPESGSELAPGLKLFYDAGCAAFSWRQRPIVGGSRYGLSFTVYEFDGTFLSLVVEVPGADLPAIAAHRNLQLSFSIAATRPLALYARLNFQRDTEHIALHDAMIVRDGAYVARFERAGDGEDLRPGVSVWADLIFAEPAMAEFEISDLALRTAPDGSAADA